MEKPCNKATAKIGRPSSVTPKVLKLLVEAFEWGWSDNAACEYAGIKVHVLYNYQRSHPEFAKRKELLRKNPELLAKRNIAKSIESGDMRTSKWYLERRSPEFQVKQQIDVTHTHEISESNVLGRLMDFMNRNRDAVGADVIDVLPEPEDPATIQAQAEALLL